MEEQDYTTVDDENQTEFLEEKDEQEIAEDSSEGQVVNFVQDKFVRAKNARRSDEMRWLKAYRNFRGIYGPETAFREDEKSRVFIKVTKTKVLAAYGQISDVLFGQGKFPLGIEPTTLPEGIADTVHFDMQETPEQAPEGPPELQPGETLQKLNERLGGLEERLAPVEGELKQGPGRTETQITYHPAMVAAKTMEKKIHDQLEESDGTKHLGLAAFEAAFLGTGIIKGPFLETKEYPRWDEEGEYVPVKKDVPKVSQVSIWNAYPESDSTSMSDCEHFIQRHKLPRSQLRALKRRPMFRGASIDAALEIGESYVEEWWESEIDLERSTSGDAVDRFEVLEYWGFVDTDILLDMDVDLDLEEGDQVSVNIWICNGQILRLVANPFQPMYLPYHVVPYEVNPYSFFGIGVAENMEDTQVLMNGFMRLSVDNAALSGNLIIEVDENNLVPGQDLTVYPGKVFRRQAGAPGQAIFGTEFPNVAAQNMMIFDKARQLADESTGLPSFAHGQTGISGVGRTSSGISMLMGAANGSVRTVVKNFDNFLISPLGKSLYYFNMQFDFDKELVGDFEVKARGTESLMANEVRSQRLMQFLSLVQNPILGPFAKMDYILREIAKSMDLDPDKVTNNLGDAAIAAKIMSQFTQEQAPPEQAAAGGPPGVQDTSGGG
ncbi:MAG: hypothetical protein KJO69_08755, partial [Gammaproteobacteria bacterium]|nr:hypothetical protein [Gammaproteobacteria bacterium]